MDFLSKREVNELLEEEYGFHVQKIDEPRITESGITFLVFLDKGGKVIVKQTHWYDFADNPRAILEKVHSVGNNIKNRGVKVQAAYQARSGGYARFRNGAPTLVLPYFEGRSFSGADADILAAGFALASFHKAGVEFLKSNKDEYENIRKTIPVEKPYEESVELYKTEMRSVLKRTHDCAEKEICALVRASTPAIDEAIDFISRAFDEEKNLAKGIIHTDFNFNNAVYDESGAAAIIDIDHLNVGCLGADIGNALASFVSRLKKMGKDEPAEKITTLFFSAYHKSNPLSLLDYKLALPSIQRTSVTRILRIMRRHHFENNRLPEMMKKIPDRFLARLKDSPKEFSFLTKEWLRKIF